MALISTKHGLESQKAQNMAHDMGCGVKRQHSGKDCDFQALAEQSSAEFSPWHSVAGFSLFLHHATPWRSRDVQRVGTVWGLTGLYSQGTQSDTYQSLPFPYSSGG